MKPPRRRDPPRDARGRFMAKPKPPPLSKQTLGDLTALTILEEAPPANILATQAVFTVHADWWGEGANRRSKEKP
jgi:hypothetical protein